MKKVLNRLVSIGLMVAMLCGGISATTLAAGDQNTPAVVTGSYHFTSNENNNIQREDTFVYRDDCFMRSSFPGCDHLLTLSAQLAISSASNYGPTEGKYDVDPSYGPDNVIEMLKNMGFEDVDTNAYYRLEKLTDSVGAAIGHRTINVAGKSYTLLAIVPRSANYKQEWVGNFTVGDEGTHAGFKAARDETLRFVKQYINSHGITGDLKVWITGHSRGAAVANLLGGFFADGGIDYFDGAVSITPEDVYCYTYATPRTIKDGASKNEVLSVAGARGAGFESDTPGEAYTYTKGGTISLTDSVYSGIRNYPFAWDFITALPPEFWGFSYYGNIYTMNDNGRVSVEEMTMELKTIDSYVYNAYMNDGDYQTFQMKDFDVLNLELVSKGDSGQQAFESFVQRRTSGLKVLGANTKDYVENGGQEMFQAFSGIYAFHLEYFGEELGEAFSKDQESAIKAVAFSYLAFASQKLQAEGRASGEAEAAAIALVELIAYATGTQLDPKTLTVDELLYQLTKFIADHPDSKLVTQLLSLAESSIPESTKPLIQLFMGSYCAKENPTFSDVLYSFLKACAYGAEEGSAAAKTESGRNPKEVRKFLYMSLGLAVHIPGFSSLGDLIGKDESGVTDGSAAIASVIGALMPQILKDGETAYTTWADAADCFLKKYLQNYFDICNPKIKENYPESYTETAISYEPRLLQNITKAREMLMGVLFYDDNTPFDTAENVQSAATLYGNFQKIPPAHYNEVFVAWGKACVRNAEGDAVVPHFTYQLTEGAGSKWTKGSNLTLPARIVRSEDDENILNYFQSVSVDGSELAEGMYQLKTGSLIVELQPAYLETLSTGSHTLSVAFNDGNTVDMQFTVAAAAAPVKPGDNPDKPSPVSPSENVKTGDTNQPYLWMILMAAGILLAAGAVAVDAVRRKKTK